MQLPPALRAALGTVLEGRGQEALRTASGRLTERYRAEVRDGTIHLNSEAAAEAYVAARMPATFAALRASLAQVAEALPDFAPQSLLDAGAGPATALWAAREVWPDLAGAELWEGSAAIRSVGERLLQEAGAAPARWVNGDLGAASFRPEAPADLVTLSYVLDELHPERRAPLLHRLWENTRGVLLLVEPGTPAGFRRILEARTVLLSAGATIAAPCPHALACPLKAPDWCHFAARVERSRIHRATKGAEVPWEDEKFIHLAATRLAPQLPQVRVLAPPRGGSGKVLLKLCESDGEARERLVTKRNGVAFREARRADWGDGLHEKI